MHDHLLYPRMWNLGFLDDAIDGAFTQKYLDALPPLVISTSNAFYKVSLSAPFASASFALQFLPTDLPNARKPAVRA